MGLAREHELNQAISIRVTRRSGSCKRRFGRLYEAKRRANPKRDRCVRARPTLRIVHVVTMRGKPTEGLAYDVAKKQLYSSHYFETALDLSFCVRSSDDLANPGF